MTTVAAKKNNRICETATMASSIIPNLTKENARVCILTDFEPDDMLALLVLFRHLPNNGEILMIVGEGLKNKTKLAVNFVRQFSLKCSCVISQGSGSSAVYPHEMLDLFSEVPHDPEGVAHTKENIVVQDLKTSLETFDFTDATVLVLKPFRELLKFVEPSRFSTTTLALYGSFNLKQTLNNQNKANIEDLLNCTFAQTILYETFFATGPNNSVNRDNSPTLFGWILQTCDAAEPNSHEAYMAAQLREAIALWNLHLANDCAQTIMEIGSALAESTCRQKWEEVSRQLTRIVDYNAKPLASIARSNSMQMVLADFALVACLFPPPTVDGRTLARYERGTFHFGEYNRTVHTLCGDKENARVLLVRDVDRDLLDARLYQLFTT